MSITDELRLFAADPYTGWVPTDKQQTDLRAIADRIDAKHQKALDEWKAKHGQMWLKGYSECHAELLEGNETLASDLERCGWIRLPKDADGEHIHVGDVMEWCDSGDTLEVIGIGDDTLFYIDPEGDRTYAEWTSARNKRHHHAPTVEDVLREMLDAWGELPSNATNDAIVAEYAAKLRLAEGEDA